MDPIAWTIESETHDYIVSDFSRRISEYDIEDVTKNPALRERLLLQTVRDLFAHFGQTWLGKYAPPRSPAPHPTEDEQVITTAINELASRTKYLTFHLFDPLSHKRLGITSVQSKHSTAELETLYDTVESLYIGLERYQPSLKTLVASINELHKARPARHIAFLLGERSPVDCTWPFIPFPSTQCEYAFATNPILQLWKSGRHADVSVETLGGAINQESSGFTADEFVAALSDILTLTPNVADAASMALSLFLWETSVTIMPYYFRGASLTMPSFTRDDAQAALRGRTFVAISCTAKEGGLSPAELTTLDSVLRGLASAIAFCGIELTRRRLSHVFIPIALNHEIGNAMWIVSGRTAALAKYSKKTAFKDALNDIVAEMAYIACTQGDIITNADLTQPLITRETGPETDSAWPEVFRVMMLRDNPPMETVTLVIAAAAKSTEISFATERCMQTLRAAQWPPALQLSRFRLRQILSNLVRNALKKGASEINIHLSPFNANPTYVCIAVQDNGDEYYPEPTDDLSRGYGHLLIDRLVNALGGEARFDRPSQHSKGASKTFSVILPLQSPWRLDVP